MKLEPLPVMAMAAVEISCRSLPVHRSEPAHLPPMMETLLLRLLLLLLLQLLLLLLVLLLLKPPLLLPTLQAARLLVTMARKLLSLLSHCAPPKRRLSPLLVRLAALLVRLAVLVAGWRCCWSPRRTTLHRPGQGTCQP